MVQRILASVLVKGDITGHPVLFTPNLRAMSSHFKSTVIERKLIMILAHWLADLVAERCKAHHACILMVKGVNSRFIKWCSYYSLMRCGQRLSELQAKHTGRIADGAMTLFLLNSVCECQCETTN